MDYFITIDNFVKVINNSSNKIPTIFSHTDDTIYKIDSITKWKFNKNRGRISIKKLDNTEIKKNFGSGSIRFSENELKMPDSNVEKCNVNDIVQLTDDEVVPTIQDEYKITELPRFTNNYTLTKISDPKIIIEKKLKEFIKSNNTNCIATVVAAAPPPVHSYCIKEQFVKGQFIKSKLLPQNIYYIDTIVYTKSTNNYEYTLINCNDYNVFIYNKKKIYTYPGSVLIIDDINTDYEIIEMKFNDAFINKIKTTETPAIQKMYNDCNTYGFFFGGYLEDGSYYIFLKSKNINPKLEKNGSEWRITIKREYAPFLYLVDTNNLITWGVVPVVPGIPSIPGTPGVEQPITRIDPFNKTDSFKPINNIININRKYSLNNINNKINIKTKYFDKYTINKKIALHNIISKILQNNSINQKQDRFMNKLLDELFKKLKIKNDLMVYSTLLFIIDQIYLYKLFSGDKRYLYIEKIKNNYNATNQYYIKDYIKHISNSF